MVSGYLKIKQPEDLEKAISKMLNKILLSEDPLLHAQKFASLANAWTNCRRLALETVEVERFKAELAALKQQIIEINKNASSMEKP